MFSLFSKKKSLPKEADAVLPVIWIFQPPRSGGTMLLRLFDGHPAVHVHPAPITFSWPRKPDLQKVQDSFSMARFNETGFLKHASNREQKSVPIDFDEIGYRSSFDNIQVSSSRALFDAAHKACFQNWRNYNYQYEHKKYVMMHSTIWSYTKVARRLTDFFDAYPDGWTIFIARPPADWLASGAKLANSKLNDTSAAIEEYITSYTNFLQNRKARSVVLEFNSLVSNPTATLTSLCSRIGIPYDNALETTTVNGTPIGANSSHAGEVKYAPDPNLVGKGADIMDQLLKMENFAEAERLYLELKKLANS